MTEKQRINITRQANEFELIVDVDGPLEGSLDDWPSHIKEPILEVMERDISKAMRQGDVPAHLTTLRVTKAVCEQDPDERQPNGDPLYFIHVIVECSAIQLKEDKVIVPMNGHRFVH